MWSKILIQCRESFWPLKVIHPQLSPGSIFEDQVLKVKTIQRNLSNHEALLAKGDTNRQEVKELTQLIYALKNSFLGTDPELSQLEVKRVELERELKNMKATIDHRKSILAQIPDAIK